MAREDDRVGGGRVQRAALRHGRLERDLHDGAGAGVGGGRGGGGGGRGGDHGDVGAPRRGGDLREGPQCRR